MPYCKIFIRFLLLFLIFFSISYIFEFPCENIQASPVLNWTDFTCVWYNLLPPFPIALPNIIAHIVPTAYTSVCTMFRVNSFQYKLNWLLSWRELAVVCDCDLSWCIIKLIIGFWIWNYEALCYHSFAVLNAIPPLLLHFPWCDLKCDFNPITSLNMTLPWCNQSWVKKGILIV